MQNIIGILGCLFLAIVLSTPLMVIHYRDGEK
jgi:hypothetical protein